MAKPSLVSVIIPTYNYAHFIREAIESVLAQTYRHFEIIVVDDGSTDGTADVVSQFPDVRYIYQPNQGTAAARNAGVLCSQANYLVFLDADDRLLPNALEAGINSLNENPTCVFVSGHWELISRDGRSMPTPPVLCIKENHYRTFLDYNYIGTIGQVMFRRSVFVSEPGFDASVPGCDDAELYMRLAKDFPVHCHDQIVVQYRVHGANTSGNKAMMLRSMTTVYGRHLEQARGNPELESLCRQQIELCRKFLAQELKKRARDGYKSNWLVKRLLDVRHRIEAALIFRRYKLRRRRGQE